VESRYRVHADRAQRAIAGLSMGGMQALEIAFSDLRDYAYVGVFSAGIFGQGGGPGTLSGPNWETQHQEALANAELRQGLKLIWFATGKEDFLVDTSRSTVDMLKQHGFEVTYHESTGGHTWANWRRYLADFALLLFR
jgi:enterochelin esterase family protein